MLMILQTNRLPPFFIEMLEKELKIIQHTNCECVKNHLNSRHRVSNMKLINLYNTSFSHEQWKHNDVAPGVKQPEGQTN